jgi:uncharacterized protein involved in type VI secretion and phage assembly
MRIPLVGNPGAGGFEDTTGTRRYFGAYAGKVTDNKHEEGEYRVRVALYSLHEDQHTHWCRIITLMAGGDRGFFCLPEIDDEVIVIFEGGDDKLGIVIGSVWNGVDTTIDSNSDQDGKNNRRWWRTRSGHEMEFNDNTDETQCFIKITTQGGHVWEMSDKDGEVYMNWIDSDGENKLTISTTDKHVVLQANSGGTIDIQTDGGIINMTCDTLNIDADTDINVTAGSNINFDAGADFNVDSGADTNITASGNINETGSKINLNC